MNLIISNECEEKIINIRNQHVDLIPTDSSVGFDCISPIWIRKKKIIKRKKNSISAVSADALVAEVNRISFISLLSNMWSCFIWPNMGQLWLCASWAFGNSCKMGAIFNWLMESIDLQCMNQSIKNDEIALDLHEKCLQWKAISRCIAKNDFAWLMPFAFRVSFTHFQIAWNEYMMNLDSTPCSFEKWCEYSKAANWLQYCCIFLIAERKTLVVLFAFHNIFNGFFNYARANDAEELRFFFWLHKIYSRKLQNHFDHAAYCALFIFPLSKLCMDTPHLQDVR